VWATGKVAASATASVGPGQFLTPTHSGSVTCTEDGNKELVEQSSRNANQPVGAIRQLLALRRSL
jgi:hypothetical protein